MDNVTIIRIIGGVLTIVVLLFLIQRRRTRIR
jgi:hypothetical protein